jgi:hypothetical protein
VSRASIHDRQFFIPAETTAEAVARIFSLTGAPQRNRGEKRALVALRDALDLDVDVVRTNAVMGAKLADALEVEWIESSFTERNKVNLAGLNALLEGATEAYQQGSLRRLASATPSTMSGPQWAAFQPAGSKIEAVTRISRLTESPAEWLGPGSKEHKSVLVNLADRLLPGVALDRSSKTRMARDIAHRLDVTWTDMCCSTGETISLEGLNTILAGAERRLGRLGEMVSDQLVTPQAEGAALAAALVDGWRAEPWDAKRCVEWMAASGVRGAHDNEWQGFYFEAKARELLNSAFPPSTRPVRTRFGNTTFDYALNRVWDLKAHTAAQVFAISGVRRTRGGVLILNDERATRQCVQEQGLGFLVLSGEALMDEDGRFVEWHRSRKQASGKLVAPSNSGTSRVRKSAFRPLRVDAFWIQDTPGLEAAISAGQLSVRPIGRQPPKEPGGSGTARADKVQMHLNAARRGLLVGAGEWSYRLDPWSVPTEA